MRRFLPSESSDDITAMLSDEGSCLLSVVAPQSVKASFPAFPINLSGEQEHLRREDGFKQVLILVVHLSDSVNPVVRVMVAIVRWVIEWPVPPSNLA